MADLWQPALTRALGTLILLALRIGPAAVLLLAGAGVGTLALPLGLGLCLALWPLSLALTPPALSFGPQLWAALPWELARGAVLALGGLLPLWAFRFAAQLSEAAWLAQLAAELRANAGLRQLYAAAALAVLFASGAHRSVLRAWTFSLLDVPLGSSNSAPGAAQAALFELAKLLARGFELGVVLAGPVLLAIASGAIVLGLSLRVSAPLSAALLRGPLLAVLGLSAACLSISSMLSELPRAVQVFIEQTLALIRGV